MHSVVINATGSTATEMAVDLVKVCDMSGKGVEGPGVMLVACPDCVVLSAEEDTET
jgi:hypothetical protein